MILFHQVVERPIGAFEGFLGKEDPGHLGKVCQIIQTSLERFPNQPHKLGRNKGSLRSPKVSGLGLWALKKPNGQGKAPVP